MFLFGQELDNAIRRIIQDGDARCAVAFWGRGADNLFAEAKQKNARIVCNLKSGGTNPFTIEKLLQLGAKVKQHDEIHAKVYIGKERAVVTSANASANGLGFEAAEQARWLEAGVVINDLNSVVDWFEQTWTDAREVTRADISAAIIAWKLRRLVRPSVLSFVDFDTEAEPLPFIAWWVNPADYTWCHKNLENQLGPMNKNLNRRLQNSIEVEMEENEEVLQPGTWILFWKRAASGFPSRRDRPYWFKTGQIVRQAYFYNSDGKKMFNIILHAEEGMFPPFDITENRFRKAFYEVLEKDKYAYLREDDERPWYGPREQYMRPLWRDLKQRYKELGIGAGGLTDLAKAGRARARPPRAGDRR